MLCDCESLRTGRKDYWTYNYYADMLEHTIENLRRRAEAVEEEIKHDKI